MFALLEFVKFVEDEVAFAGGTVFLEEGTGSIGNIDFPLMLTTLIDSTEIRIDCVVSSSLR